jgi:uncharacterized delta-60 repeat protein
MTFGRNALTGGALLAAAALAGCGSDGGPSFDPITTGSDVVLTEANDLRGLIFAANGSIYGAGFTNVNPDDQQTVVLRTSAAGALDSTFGEGGVVVLNLVQGNEQALALVELANGDVVVVVNVSDEQGGEDIPDVDGGDPVPRPNGQDVVLVRLDSNGDPRATFGTDGVLPVTFGWAAADDASWPVPTYTASNPEASRFSGAGFPNDTAWDLQLDTSGASERLVVFGMGPAAYSASGTQRVDMDRYIVRLNADGTPDGSFNGGENFTFHTEGTQGDNARRGLVEPDGSIVSSGYTNFGEGFDNHVVLIRLLPNGTVDTSFGFGFPSARPGATRFNPYVADGGAAEAYGVVRLSDGTYVTTGYGAVTGEGTASTLGYETTLAQDVVIFGLTASGLCRTSAMAASSPSRARRSTLETDEDRGRALAVLPDDRTVHVGRFGGAAAIFVVRPDGTLDETVGDGGRIVYGTSAVTAQFFNVAVSADGTRIAAATNNDANGVRLVTLEVGAD